MTGRQSDISPGPRPGVVPGGVRGLVLAAPASHHGKTVITAALLAALCRRGVKVAAAKLGPDYIDTAFHGAASRRTAINLDGWAMRAETLAAAVAKLGGIADLVLAEGAMGLFDGALGGATGGAGSTADIAGRAGWPIVLVMDVRGQAASAAAVIEGFANHRAGTGIDGVLFNRVGSARHEQALRAAVAASRHPVAILGCLPRSPALRLPERHLGLVQAGEMTALDAWLDAAAALAEAHIDIPALIDLAQPARFDAPGDEGLAVAPLAPLGQRIAVAEDNAFAFAYPAIVDGWRRAGAAITPFSPLAGEAPAADADAIYLPGGYPELYAGILAANERFLAALRAAARRGATVYGECGGYMVMGRGLVDGAGARHAMAGLLALETSFAEPRLHLGYRRVRTKSASPLGLAGAAFRGHEFHYATVSAEGPENRLFDSADAAGNRLPHAGLRDGSAMGSFVHLIDRAG